MRIWDEARRDALRPRIEDLNLTLPDAPEGPEFDELIERLNVIQPDLSRAVLAAVLDQTGAQTHERFTAMAGRSNLGQALRQRMKGAVQRTNHKNRQQLNPALVIGGVVGLFIVAAVVLLGFPSGGQKDLAPGTSDQAAVGGETAGTAAAAGEQTGPPTPQVTPAAGLSGVDVNGHAATDTAASGGTGQSITPTTAPAPATPTYAVDTTPSPMIPVGDTSLAPTPAPVTYAVSPASPVTTAPVTRSVSPLPTMSAQGKPVEITVPSGVQPVTGQPVAVQPVAVPPGVQPVTVQPGQAPARGLHQVVATSVRPPIGLTAVTPAGAAGGGGAAPGTPGAAAPRTGLMNVSATPAAATSESGRALSVVAPAATPASTAAPASQRGLYGVTQAAGGAPAGAAGGAAQAASTPTARSGLNVVSASPTAGGVAGSAAPAGGVAAGAAPAGAPVQDVKVPYHLGDLVPATLMTGAVVAEDQQQGRGLLVYAQAEDGSRWRGLATVGAGGRIQVAFDRVLLPSGVDVPVTADAVGTDAARLPGIAATLRRETPDAAQQLLAAFAGGVKTFAEQSARGATTVTGTTVVTAAPRPNFWVTLGGAVAGALMPVAPAPSSAPVNVYVVPGNTPVLIAVRGG